MALKLTTYLRSKNIPDLPGSHVFHSKELFQLYEATPGYTPLMIVASEAGRPMARLLAAIRKSTRWFPPALIRRCEIYDTGEYFDPHIDKEELFGEMLEHLTREVKEHSFLIEFRNLQNAKFGYRFFRKNHYFAVNWLRVRNSLHHDLPPEERFSESRLRQIKKGLKNGAEVGIAESLEEIKEFSQMLRYVYSARIRKHFPSIEFFRHIPSWLTHDKLGKIFIVRYKGRIIGGSACIFSGENAYLWFSGGMRKTFALQYPGVLAVWKAISYACEHNYRHLEFMNVGLPFRKNPYREFVLRFGGKQSSTRRWFRFRWNWLNKLCIRMYA